MINRVVLVGRFTRDPELRRTQSGTAVTSFTIAMNRKNTNPNNERQADFINCIAWNKLGENIERYCSKGQLVGVEGRLQSRSYDANDGRRVNVVEVVCESVQFLESKNTSNKSQNTNYNQNEYNFDSYTNDFEISYEDIEF